MPSFSGSGERPTDTPLPQEEEGHKRFLPKTSRRTLGLALVTIAVGVLVVSAWIASGRAPIYPDVTAFADDLTAHGFTCDLEAVNVVPDREGLGSESGHCFIDGQQTFLAVYRDLTATPQEVEGGYGGLVMARGPNWTVISDAATARSIADALNGDVIEEGGNPPGS